MDQERRTTQRQIILYRVHHAQQEKLQMKQGTTVSMPVIYVFKAIVAMGLHVQLVRMGFTKQPKVTFFIVIHVPLMNKLERQAVIHPMIVTVRIIFT
jgi:hypothetical protein